MSRNIDKSRTVLNLYQEKQSDYKEYSRYKRPKRVEQVGSLKESLEWYKQTLRDISNQSSRLYDPSLNEEQLRDVNERVNVLIRESERWARHLYKRFKHKCRRNVHGGTVIRGTRYIGRAQELPEVQIYKKQNKKTHATYTIDPKRLHNAPKEYYIFNDVKTSKTLPTKKNAPHIEIPVIPTQEEVQKYLVQRRKQQLLEQLKL